MIYDCKPEQGFIAIVEDCFVIYKKSTDILPK